MKHLHLTVVLEMDKEELVAAVKKGDVSTKSLLFWIEENLQFTFSEGRLVEKMSRMVG